MKNLINKVLIALTVAMVMVTNVSAMRRRQAQTTMTKNSYSADMSREAFANKVDEVLRKLKGSYQSMSRKTDIAELNRYAEQYQGTQNDVNTIERTTNLSSEEMRRNSAKVGGAAYEAAQNIKNTLGLSNRPVSVMSSVEVPTTKELRTQTNAAEKATAQVERTERMITTSKTISDKEQANDQYMQAQDIAAQKTAALKESLDQLPQSVVDKAAEIVDLQNTIKNPETTREEKPELMQELTAAKNDLKEESKGQTSWTMSSVVNAIAAYKKSLLALGGAAAVAGAGYGLYRAGFTPSYETVSSYMPTKESMRANWETAKGYMPSSLRQPTAGELAVGAGTSMAVGGLDYMRRGRNQVTPVEAKKEAIELAKLTQEVKTAENKSAAATTPEAKVKAKAIVDEKKDKLNNELEKTDSYLTQLMSWRPFGAQKDPVKAQEIETAKQEIARLKDLRTQLENDLALTTEEKPGKLYGTHVTVKPEMKDAHKRIQNDIATIDKDIATQAKITGNAWAHSFCNLFTKRNAAIVALTAAGAAAAYDVYSTGGQNIKAIPGAMSSSAKSAYGTMSSGVSGAYNKIIPSWQQVKGGTSYVASGAYGLGQKGLGMVALLTQAKQAKALIDSVNDMPNPTQADLQEQADAQEKLDMLNQQIQQQNYLADEAAQSNVTPIQQETKNTWYNNPVTMAVKRGEAARAARNAQTNATPTQRFVDVSSGPKTRAQFLAEQNALRN